MFSTSQRRLCLFVSLATLLPIPAHIDAADIVISVQRGNAPATIIEVAEGSRVKIAADGTVEVTLPGAQVPNRAVGPQAIAPTFTLPHPDQLKLERPFQVRPSVAFSPDGKLLASTDSQATIYLWDVQTRREVRRFHGPEKLWHPATATTT